MTKVSRIGLDLAKNVFQVHGVDAAGEAVVAKRLRRGEVVRFFEALEPCEVAMEACGTAHHWARTLQALGHEVRLLPPSYVKPYVKRGKKNDAADAAAICEAAGRPDMRRVPVKSPEQQAVLMLHRARELLVRQRTMLINAVRAHLAEFGMVVAQGTAQLRKLVTLLDVETGGRLPRLARPALDALIAQIAAAETQLHAVEAEIVAWHKANAASRRLATIPGVGPITASAIVATAGDPGRFRSGRHFAAWIGLVPRQHSSGGKQRLGGIAKMGDRYLRKLLVIGATGLIRRARGSTAPEMAWIRGLLARRPARLVSVARANKTARIAWAILARGGIYQPRAEAEPAAA